MRIWLFLNLPVEMFVKTIVAKATCCTIGVLFVGLMLTSSAYSQGLMRKAVAIWLFDEDGGKKVTDLPAIITMASSRENPNGCLVNSDRQ